MKGNNYTLLSIFLVSQFIQAQTSDVAFTPSFDAVSDIITESHAFFGEERRTWIETSARLGLQLLYSDFTLVTKGVALKTSGSDKYGSGSIWLADSSAPGRNVLFDVDNAYLSWSNIGGGGLTATLGRQNITLGSQFLVGDGVYDGFHSSARQCVYHNPRKWFDALRLQWKSEIYSADGFIYSVHPTWDGGGERNGWFGGVDVSCADPESQALYAGGLFYRNSASDKDNDMALLNLRVHQTIASLSGLSLGGEVVWEFGGTGRNVYYVTSIGQKVNEAAFHAEASYSMNATALQPFAEVGYVYYSKDFTPVATGFSDWGKWYLGNQIDWMIFSTDSRIIRAQAGFLPTETTKLRVQFHSTSLASSSMHLSDEFSLIGEWYPNAWLWVNALVGYAIPGNGLSASGLGNPFSWINSDAAVYGSSKSLDVVLAFGITL